MTGHRLSIAVAQTCARDGDIAANLEQHVMLAAAAADGGADLVVFPELSLTGYDVPRAAELAFAEHDARLEPLADVASTQRLIIVVGAPVRIGRRLHIGAFIIAGDGTISLYTKQRLGAFSESARCDGVVPPAENSVFQPGDRDPLIHVAGGTAAMAVCADAGRAEHAQRAAARGANIYLASMFVIPSEFAADAAKLGGYAERLSMIVAMANHGAATGGLAAAGRSSIWSATGELVTRLGAAGAGVAIATTTADGWSAKHMLLDAAAQ